MVLQDPEQEANTGHPTAACNGRRFRPPLMWSVRSQRKKEKW
jgi:hypothetical protein